MVRHPVHTRTTFAAPPVVEIGGARGVRPFVAAWWPVVGRVLLAPFVLVLSAIAGVLFAILLPVCGIATIAEAMARGGWGFVRGALSHLPARRIRQN